MQLQYSLELFPDRKSQVGATAIEFALAFPLFFLLLYSVLMYAFVFLTQLGVQHAAEEGARAALRYPDLAAAEDQESELALRLSRAESVAAQQLSWFPSKESISVDVAICRVGSSSCDGIDSQCTLANAYAFRCQVLVTVIHPYAEIPVVPPLPGMGLMVPTLIQGNARVLLDGRAMSVL